MIKEKEVELKNQDGVSKTFILSRLPAVPMREIMAKYPVSNIPKLGDYEVSKEVMTLLLSFVGVRVEGRDEPLLLNTIALINNHVDDAEQLLRLEYAMLEYNTSFFGQGGASNFFAGLLKKHLPLIIQTLMDSLPPSLVRDLRAPLNSEKKST
jgi:hypothetical protein